MSDRSARVVPNGLADRGDVAGVRAFLEGNQEVACNNAFLTACCRGHLDVVNLMLEMRGSQCLRPDVDPLMGACMNGHIDIIQRLLELEGDCRVEALPRHLRIVCYAGRLEVVDCLLRIDGDRRIDLRAEGSIVFFAACFSGRLPVLDRLLSLTGDRYISFRDISLHFGQAFPDRILQRLLSLRGKRAIPHSMLVLHNVVDPFPRITIAEWSRAREERMLRRSRRRPRGSPIAQALHRLPRAALAEVLQQLARPE